MSCGRELKPEARFCGYCGAAQEQPTRGAGVRAQPPAPATPGERRQLTILFVDLVGSTAASTRLDPEEWGELLAQYHDATSQLVRRFGGSVVKFLGDGVLALFGYPRANEDDAERAVRSALAIVEMVPSLPMGSSSDPAAGVNGEAPTTSFSARAGIHTGVSVITELDGRPDVFGEAPNIAARVETAAAPGTVLISEATQRLVAGLFVVEARGAQALKGVPTPMALYRVVQPSGVRSRLDIAAGHLTPFVGRAEEIATLAERWERVKTGEGQCVLISGEAGVGKSRLIYELRRRLSGSAHTWVECAGTPYTQGTPFFPVVALVTQALMLEPEESPAEQLGRMERGLGELASTESVALLADFLGLPVPTPLEMNADVQRRKTINLLAQWSLRLSAMQPLVIVVEDLHWCDASSLVLINQIATRGATAPLLLVATTRPGPWPSWARRSHALTLTLARLTAEQARTMIATLGGQELASPTRDLVVSRADGVPLFVEELTKATMESGAQSGVEAIPATLADSLMARLDRLSSAKEVAQRASVLGREFSYRLLAGIAEMDDATLRDGLARLVDAEILFGRGDPPDATYTFKHALMQEAAYGSLLRRTRQHLHGCVLDALTAPAPEPLTVHPELIGRHAEAAGRIPQAIAAYHQAGEAAQARCAHEEAVGQLRRALELLGSPAASPERDAREAAIQLALGGSLIAGVGFAHPDARKALERAVALYEAVDETRPLGFALGGLSTYAHNCGELRRADDLATRLLTLAEQSGDSDLALLGHRCMQVIQYYQGKFSSALAHSESILALYGSGRREAAALTVTGDLRTTAKAAASLNLIVLGWPERALAYAQEAEALARAIEHPFSIAHAVFYAASLHYYRRDLGAVRAQAGEAAAVGEAQGFATWTVLGRTWEAAARVAAGETEAMTALLAGARLMIGTDGDGPPPQVSMTIADACLLSGLFDEAQTAVANGLRVSALRGQNQSDAELHRLAAELVLATGGPPAQAEVSLQRALEVARVQEARWFELRAATTLARLLLQQERRAAARALLEPVYGWFTEGFALPDLVAAQRLLNCI